MITRFSAGFVLAFHDIAPDRAAAFIDALHPARPVPLSELVKRSRASVDTRGLFAITIDDGVGETVRSLSALFLARKWPATFYLPTRYLDGGAMTFQLWRRIQPLLPRKKLKLAGGVLDLTQPGAVEKLAREMEQRWHTEPIESYQPVTMELIDLVARERGIAKDQLRPDAPITWDEVGALARHDLLSFESHGVSHAAVSSMSDEELADEFKGSRDTIAAHTGRSCRHLAYPFGNPSSIGPRAPAIAARFYDSAVTMSLGHVDSANPWLLPRIPLYPENSGLKAAFKIFLKCRVSRRRAAVG